MWRIDSAELQPARVLLTTLILCVAASLVKFFLAWQTLSLSVMADAAFALLAVTANLSGLLSLGLDSAEPEESPDLPAERWKLNALVLVIICLLLGATLAELFATILDRLRHTFVLRPFPLVPALLALLATGAAHYIWSRMIVGATRNQSLLPSHEAGQAQSITVLAAMVGLFAWAFGHPAIDAVIAIAILALVLRAIFRLVYACVRAKPAAREISAEEFPVVDEPSEDQAGEVLEEQRF